MGGMQFEHGRGGAGLASEVAVPVGGHRPCQIIQAMTVALDPTVDGGLIYGGDVPVLKCDSMRRELRVDDEVFTWLRTEFQRAGGEPGGEAVQVGDLLVLSSHPYSAFWAQTLRFKGPNKKAEAVLGDAAPKTREEAAALIAGLGVDYWVTTATPTAALSDATLEDAMEEVRQGGRSAVINTFGLIPGEVLKQRSLKALEEQLVGSAEARKLLKMTADGSLVVRFEGKGKEFIEPMVKEWAWTVLLIAARQALAGPYKNEGRYVGGPVVKFMEEIYTDLIANLNRRVSDPLDAPGRCNVDDFDLAADWGNPELDLHLAQMREVMGNNGQ